MFQEIPLFVIFLTKIALFFFFFFPIYLLEVDLTPLIKVKRIADVYIDFN